MAKQGKMLVAYFSHKGKNYTKNGIKELKKGNTEAVAEIIVRLTGADAFEIETAETYPFEYYECTDKAKAELEANSRPLLKKNMDIGGYDRIILGYPNWWNTMPMAVFSFLDGKDFGGKTVLPYCTNEGSGMGVSERDLANAIKGADIRKGLAICGSDAASSEGAVKSWLASNGIIE